MFGSNEKGSVLARVIIVIFVLFCLFMSGKYFYNKHVEIVDGLKGRVSQLETANAALTLENSNLKKDIEMHDKISDIKDEVFEKDTEKQDKANEDHRKIVDDSARERRKIREDSTIPEDKKLILILENEWEALNASHLLLEQSVKEIKK